MTFFPHFLELLNIDSIVVEVNVLDKISIEEGWTRNELADTTYEVVANSYQKVIS